jgi:hypothetical protein
MLFEYLTPHGISYPFFPIHPTRPEATQFKFRLQLTFCRVRISGLKGSPLAIAFLLESILKYALILSVMPSGSPCRHPEE